MFAVHGYTHIGCEEHARVSASDCDHRANRGSSSSSGSSFLANARRACGRKSDSDLVVLWGRRVRVSVRVHVTGDRVKTTVMRGVEVSEDELFVCGLVWRMSN